MRVNYPLHISQCQLTVKRPIVWINTSKYLLHKKITTTKRNWCVIVNYVVTHKKATHTTYYMKWFFKLSTLSGYINCDNRAEPRNKGERNVIHCLRLYALWLMCQTTLSVKLFLFLLFVKKACDRFFTLFFIYLFFLLRSFHNFDSSPHEY